MRRLVSALSEESPAPSEKNRPSGLRPERTSKMPRVAVPRAKHACIVLQIIEKSKHGPLETGFRVDCRQPFPYQIMEVFPVIRPQSRSGGSQKPPSGPESFSEWLNRSAGTAFCMLRMQHAYVVIATWRYP